MKKIQETGSTDQGVRAADRSTHVMASTAVNMTGVHELVLSQKDRTQTRQIARQKGLTQHSILRSFTAISV